MDASEERELMEGEMKPEEEGVVDEDAARELQDELSTGGRRSRKRSLRLQR